MPSDTKLIDEAFTNYDEIKKELPEVQPYFIVQKEVLVTCSLGFNAVMELGIESQSLKIDPDCDQRFFKLLDGFLEERIGISELSVSKSEFTHLDEELTPEFGGIALMTVTPQEMHRFLEVVDKDEEYFFYMNHKTKGVMKINVIFGNGGWFFMCWEFNESPTLPHELIVHRKRA